MMTVKYIWLFHTFSTRFSGLNTRSTLVSSYMGFLILCDTDFFMMTLKYIWIFHPFSTRSSGLSTQRVNWVSSSLMVLTHQDRVTHICISKQTIIGSDNGLSPGWRQAIIWTNAGILLIGTLETNFSEILIEIRIFSFKKMILNVSSAKWRPCCIVLNVLIVPSIFIYQYKWMKR